MEQFANNCSTKVDSYGYTAGSGVLNVESTAAPWPQIGNFRVSVIDALTGVLKVILNVTAVNSTTQWAVAPEGSDADADGDDDVFGTITTAAVMEVQRPGLFLIETKEANNSSSLDFTDLRTDIFDELMFEFINVQPVTHTASLLMRMSTDGGATYDSGTNYGWMAVYHYAGGGSYGGGDSGQNHISMSCGIHATIANGGLVGDCRVYNLASADKWKWAVITTGVDNATHLYAVTGRGAYRIVTAVNAIRFFMSTGNISAGKIRLYGVRR